MTPNWLRGAIDLEWNFVDVGKKISWGRMYVFGREVIVLKWGGISLQCSVVMLVSVSVSFS